MIVFWTECQKQELNKCAMVVLKKSPNYSSNWHLNLLVSVKGILLMINSADSILTDTYPLIIYFIVPVQ